MFLVSARTQLRGSAHVKVCRERGCGEEGGRKGIKERGREERYKGRREGGKV